MCDYERCDGEFEIIDEYVGINTEEDLANMDISRELEMLDKLAKEMEETNV